MGGRGRIRAYGAAQVEEEDVEEEKRLIIKNHKIKMEKEKRRKDGKS